MSLREKLEFQKKTIDEEKIKQEKLAQEQKDNELLKQIKTKQEEKNEWEENLTNLESGYSQGKESLENLKTSRNNIDEVYSNPDYVEAIGDQTKQEFVKSNEGEEEIQSYREKEQKVRSQVSPLVSIKNFFKGKLPNLDFRGGEEQGKVPRQESIAKIKEKIGEMDKETRGLYEQTSAGQKELEEKRKKEIIERHNKQYGYGPTYTEITGDDLLDSEKWGEDFVKGTIVEFNHNKIDEKYDSEKKRSDLDKQENLVNFSKEYLGSRNEIDESLRKVTSHVREVADKLRNKFAGDEKLKDKFQSYFNGSRYDDLATFIINQSVAFMDKVDVRGDVPSALSQGIKNLCSNKEWEKVFSNSESANSFGSFKNYIVRPEYVKQLINYYQAGINKLESHIENNPQKLLEDKDNKGGIYEILKKEVNEDLKPNEKLKLFYVGNDLYNQFLRGVNFNKFKQEVNKKLEEIEKNKDKDYVSVDKEIENNWLAKKIQIFQINNKEVIEKDEKIEKKKIIAKDLSNELSDKKYSDQSAEVIKVTDNQDRRQSIIYINSAAEEVYYDKRKVVDKLQEDLNNLENNKKINEDTKRGILSKKKLNEELSFINDNIEKIKIELNKQKKIMEEAQGKKDFFNKVKNTINEKVSYSQFEFPNGEMNFSEFIEKMNLKIKEVLNENLDPDEIEKVKEYKELKKKLEEVNKDWGGKRIWSR